MPAEEWDGEGQRERETQNPKQAPGSKLSAQSPMRGLNPQTVRSWSEWSPALIQLSHPGAPFVSFPAPPQTSLCAFTPLTNVTSSQSALCVLPPPTKGSIFPPHAPFFISTDDAYFFYIFTLTLLLHCDCHEGTNFLKSLSHSFKCNKCSSNIC